MTTPTVPPEWALREAHEVILNARNEWRGPMTSIETEYQIVESRVALALDAARRGGIEEAAQAAKSWIPQPIWRDAEAAFRALASKEPT